MQKWESSTFLIGYQISLILGSTDSSQRGTELDLSSTLTCHIFPDVYILPPLFLWPCPWWLKEETNLKNLNNLCSAQSSKTDFQSLIHWPLHSSTGTQLGFFFFFFFMMFSMTCFSPQKREVWPLTSRLRLPQRLNTSWHLIPFFFF